MTRLPLLPPLPQGPFRFAALDVETANNTRGSICQIGVAFVREDGGIETWVTHVDPQTEDWSCTWVHGITAETVAGAPLFGVALEPLVEALSGMVLYQHSTFDRAAINAACLNAGIEPPLWEWQDSVRVARKAWPELKGKGGHGLASLKRHLSLRFRHHDAGEDARAAAQVVLLAEAGHRPVLPESGDDLLDS